MTDRMSVDRRTALHAAGVTGAALAAAPLLASPATTTAAETSSPAISGLTKPPAPAVSGAPQLLTTPGKLGAPPVDGLHLTFGADPASEMYASWGTATAVRRPRVSFGTVDGGHGDTVAAETRTYVDGASSREVYVHHAHISGLRSDETYVYSVLHDGVLPELPSFV